MYQIQRTAFRNRKSHLKILVVQFMRKVYFEIKDLSNYLLKSYCENGQIENHHLHIDWNNNTM